MGNDFHLKDGFRMYHGDTVPGRFAQHADGRIEEMS